MQCSTLGRLLAGYWFAVGHLAPTFADRHVIMPRAGEVDRALHGTGAGSAAQRVGLKGTSWREQDVPNSCREYDILIYQLKVVHMFVKFPTVIFHGTWRFGTLPSESLHVFGVGEHRFTQRGRVQSVERSGRRFA
jgi:hypothetical protein